MTHQCFRFRAVFLVVNFWIILSSASCFAADEPATATPKLSDEEAQKVAYDRFQNVARAFRAYANVYQEYPPAALVSKDGESLLSWRVLLLPHLGHDKLFREFQLTEPWDSPHNKKLLAKIPQVYSPVRAGASLPHATHWQVFTGPGTLFDDGKTCRMSDIAGSYARIFLVEAGQPTLWTKPEDLPYDAKKPLPKLGFIAKETFLFATANGAVYLGRRDFQEQAMRSSIGRTDGNVFRLDGGILADKQLGSFGP